MLGPSLRRGEPPLPSLAAAEAAPNATSNAASNAASNAPEAALVMQPALKWSRRAAREERLLAATKKGDGRAPSLRPSTVLSAVPSGKGTAGVLARAAQKLEADRRPSPARAFRLGRPGSIGSGGAPSEEVTDEETESDSVTDDGAANDRRVRRVRRRRCLCRRWLFNLVLEVVSWHPRREIRGTHIPHPPLCRSFCPRCLLFVRSVILLFFVPSQRTARASRASAVATTATTASAAPFDPLGSSAFESTDELNRAWRDLQDIDQVTLHRHLSHYSFDLFP